MNTHQLYIKRCIQIAKNGLGTTYPNPLVGSVIVHNGKIIGEGWHQKAGFAHAEVHAIASVRDPAVLPYATIYVSLEPCSHFGKTPPCSNLIIEKKIPNVVIGTIDPFAKVAGQGIKKLIAAGANVIVGVLENECKDLNKRFFTFHNKKRPYVILKWAQTANGYIAPAFKTQQAPVWLSSVYAQQLSHKWRTQEQAILVGTQTVIDDNPTLTARNWFGNNPIRIVLDQNNRIATNSSVFNSDSPTVLLDSKTIDFNNNLAQNILTHLYQNNIQSVIIEGGQKTLQTFINANLWDEARIFKTPTVLPNGIKAPEIQSNTIQTQTIQKDQLVHCYNY